MFVRVLDITENVHMINIDHIVDFGRTYILLSTNTRIDIDDEELEYLQKILSSKIVEKS